MSATQLIGTELNITREFDAPREQVFSAWTDPKMLAAWWGPRMFTAPVCQVDPRPGGALYIEMQGPDGVRLPMKGTFLEVVRPEKLVFDAIAMEDAAGKVLLSTRTSVTLTERDGKTVLALNVVVTQATPEAGQALSGMEIGWNQTLDKLGEYISG